VIITRKGVKVNSAYRSPESNAAVGGSKTSDHCKGGWRPILKRFPEWLTPELAEYIKNNYEFTQLIL